jgi:hypothetical protein
MTFYVAGGGIFKFGEIYGKDKAHGATQEDRIKCQKENRRGSRYY